VLDITAGRELVRRCIEGRPIDRSPVVLHLGPYAARLQQSSYQQVCADPTMLANSLHSAQRLFGCDGLIVLMDSTLEAEACGCDVAWHDDEPEVVSHPLAGVEPGAHSLAVEGVENQGRLAVALEAARRLNTVAGKEVALFPAVTGPVTLASHLRGPSFWADLDESPDLAYQTLEVAGQVMVRVARQYLDAGFEQLLVSDPLLGRVDATHYPQIAAVLRTLWNVADFYDAHVLLQTDVSDDSRLEGLLGLGAAGLIADGHTEADRLASGGDGHSCRIATGVSAALIEGDQGDMERVLSPLRAAGGRSGPLVACCTIPRSTPPANVHNALRILRG